MLKTSASGVLASLRGSTYRSVRFTSSLAAALPVERGVSAHRGGWVRTEAILSILRGYLMCLTHRGLWRLQGSSGVFLQPARHM